VGLRYSSLGSGSEGNALLVEATWTGSERVRVLLDCGFGLRECLRRLAIRDVEPESINAILVTHEHADHAGGVARLARKFQIPVMASFGTLAALVEMSPMQSGTYPTRVVCSHTAFDVGTLRVFPYPVPHDAREPTQFVFEHAGKRLGVLTDVGTNTACIQQTLSRCDALILECNHDEHLLAHSEYPERLKRRISGDFGHLSNRAAASLLASLDRSRLIRVHAAHLSRQNNTEQLARRALSEVEGIDRVEVFLATQDDGFEWATL
jgi:phosphoribosyl 1,2-cyclic phosphodiesterase